MMKEMSLRSVNNIDAVGNLIIDWDKAIEDDNNSVYAKEIMTELYAMCNMNEDQISKFRKKLPQYARMNCSETVAEFFSF